MEDSEIRKLADLEDRHWWYRERRAVLRRQLRRLGTPGRALDVGAAGGGNTRVLRAAGWRALALEYSGSGARVAAGRGLDVIRADLRHVPVAARSMDLVVAFDILEHVEEDVDGAAEFHRVLRPGGRVLVAVPCDMRLWSAHDVAVSHVRRYSRESLTATMTKAGFVVDRLSSWNTLLRPAAAWNRKRSAGSDLRPVPAAVNLGLSAVIAAERFLPVGSLPGVSLLLRAHRPV